MLNELLKYGSLSDNVDARDEVRNRPSSYVPTGKKRKPTKFFIITFPNGKEQLVDNLCGFCKEHNLNQGNMSVLSRSSRTQHKGYQCLDVTDDPIQQQRKLAEGRTNGFLYKGAVDDNQ